MDKIYNKFKKTELMAVTAFCLLFMTVGFLQICSLTFGHPIISVIQWPTIALGGVIIAYRFLNFKHYISSKGLWLLVALAAAYLVSTAITYKYGYYENIRHLIFMVFQFGILYATGNEDKDYSIKRLKICAVYYMIVAAVLSLASFVTMFAGISKVYLPDSTDSGPVYFIGFHIGRLFGLYWDPNIASVIAVVSILISVYFIIATKKVLFKILLSLNIALQFLYIVFSGSRTGLISIIAGLFVATLLYAMSHKFSLNKLRQALAVICAAACVMAAIVVLPTAIKSGYNAIFNSFDSSDSDSEDSEEDIFDRGYDMSGDVSNRRFDIWMSAVEIAKTSPFFGVSRANITAYAKDKLPDTYIVNNDYMDFESMHNLYFEILASQGVVGLLLFIAFAILSIVLAIKNAKAIWHGEHRLIFIMLLSVIAAVCTCTLVIAEIIYVISPISTMFWICLSALNNSLKKEAVK